MRFLPFIAAFGIVLPVAVAGLGYRTLWADELETAERARSIEAYGVPTIFDARGNLSVNTGGREIEEGRLHRYTPWLQFYAGAAGLAVGRALGISPDASVRLPFATFHAATSGIVAEGLVTSLGFHPAAAVGLAALYGFSSVRLIHDRTARYHALTDLLFIGAWAVFGRLRRRKREAPEKKRELLFLSVFLAILVGAVLHTHTLVGFLAIFVFGFLYLYEERESRRLYVFAGVLVLIAVAFLALVRPWEQNAIWGVVGPRKGRSLRSFFEVGFPFYFAVFSFFLVSGLRPAKEAKAWLREAALFSILVAGIAVGIRILDLHPFSQTRYYLPIIGPLLFWPLAIGSGRLASKSARAAYAAALVGALLLAEASPDIGFFQGLRVADFDRRARGDSQPLREIFAEIARTGPAGAPVLMDYNPQAVNWYLPDQRPALVPDPTTLSSLGRENRALPAMVAPEWHVSFPESRIGFWVCDRSCDYARIGDPSLSNRYAIRSATLGKTYGFCVVKRWKSDDWNNAPFANYGADAISPEGPRREDLVLAKRCTE